MPITLATLAQATPQEVFDQVATHLLWQNQKAKKEDTGGCQYRGMNGTMCAAGCLIGDGEYNPDWEVFASAIGGGWRTLVNQGIVPSYHKELIGSLQGVHDGYDPCLWKEKLVQVASQYDLVWKH